MSESLDFFDQTEPTPRSEFDLAQHLASEGASFYEKARSEFVSARSWRRRYRIICYIAGDTRLIDEAFHLCMHAIRDRSSQVRSIACFGLAFSLREQAISALEPLLHDANLEVAKYAARAIDAIKHSNHHYFMDPEHDGRTKWNWGPSFFALFESGQIDGEGNRIACDKSKSDRQL